MRRTTHSVKRDTRYLERLRECAEWTGAPERVVITKPDEERVIGFTVHGYTGDTVINSLVRFIDRMTTRSG